MDFRLYQALRETRPIARSGEGEQFSRLREVLDEVLAIIGDDSQDVAYDRASDRIDRDVLHASPRDRVLESEEPIDDVTADVYGALTALRDDTSPERAATATETLVRLRDAMG